MSFGEECQVIRRMREDVNDARLFLLAEGHLALRMAAETGSSATVSIGPVRGFFERLSLLSWRVNLNAVVQARGVHIGYEGL